MTCKNCGAQIAEGKKFCRGCGAAINVTQAVIQEQQPIAVKQPVQEQAASIKETILVKKGFIGKKISKRTILFSCGAVCLLLVAVIVVVIIRSNNLQYVPFEDFVQRWSRAIDRDGHAAGIFEEKLEVYHESLSAMAMATSPEHGVRSFHVNEVILFSERHLIINADIRGSLVEKQNSLKSTLRIAYPRMSEKALNNYIDQFTESARMGNYGGYKIKIQKVGRAATIEITPEFEKHREEPTEPPVNEPPPSENEPAVSSPAPTPSPSPTPEPPPEPTPSSPFIYNTFTGTQDNFTVTIDITGWSEPIMTGTLTIEDLSQNDTRAFPFDIYMDHEGKCSFETDEVWIWFSWATLETLELLLDYRGIDVFMTLTASDGTATPPVPSPAPVQREEYMGVWSGKETRGDLTYTLNITAASASRVEGSITVTSDSVSDRGIITVSLPNRSEFGDNIFIGEFSNDGLGNSGEIWLRYRNDGNVDIQITIHTAGANSPFTYARTGETRLNR
jgi:hypothetical protein